MTTSIKAAATAFMLDLLPVFDKVKSGLILIAELGGLAGAGRTHMGQSPSHRQNIGTGPFDGGRVASCSSDGTARVWDVASETRAPEQLAQVIRSRSCVRFDSHGSNVIVRCTPPAAESQDNGAA